MFQHYLKLPLDVYLHSWHMISRLADAPNKVNNMSSVYAHLHIHCIYNLKSRTDLLSSVQVHFCRASHMQIYDISRFKSVSYINRQHVDLPLTKPILLSSLKFTWH